MNEKNLSVKVPPTRTLTLNVKNDRRAVGSGNFEDKKDDLEMLFKPQPTR